MARYTYFRNLNDSIAEDESFDVTVHVSADEATVTGPEVLKLFDALEAWGPGAANARFNVGLGNTTLEDWEYTGREDAPAEGALDGVVLRLRQRDD